MIEPVDVCVVGAGPCGSVVAKELAERGWSVVVLEAGPRWNPARDFLADELAAARLYWPDPRTCAGADPVEPKQAIGVGGTSQVWQAVCPRFEPSDFALRTREGLADDWPIDYATVARYYPRVEATLGVIGAPGSPLVPHQPSWLARVLARGTSALGIPGRPAPIAIAATPQPARAACVQCGWCTSGCQTDAKATAANTYVPLAEGLGARIVTGAFVTRLRLDSTRTRIASVCYVDASGREWEQPCRTLVLAAGVLETPRLLLNSTSGAFPDGLANRSGLVGKYLTVHAMRMVFGRFPFAIDAYRGFEIGAWFVDAFQGTRPGAGHARGYVLEAAHFRPLALGLTAPAGDPSAVAQLLGDYANHGAWWICGEALPQIENTVTLDPDVKDRRGLPVTRTTYAWHPNDLLLMEAAGRKARDLLEAAGAEAVTMSPVRSAHLAGTTRMGDDAERSVVNRFGQSHDIPNLFIADASIFVTAGGTNITLTSMAVATHVAASLEGLARSGAV